ncbi:hypothetical protein BDV26DRAFT_277453 [Aspergillus bertholletiae]|uniref:Uncharacterized protein n=1 Tax=Aspergillus bertholletiae TaxID=1226010 RepID=A0A5N7BNM7_9EURO|nr:hypothetical protein BDV26DRAFT_277453 [Aspergillus bertholletiae]
MRLLKSSHSDAHSSESEPISESLSSQVRSTTSSSHSSYAEDPKSPSFVRELQQDGERSAIMEDAQTKGQDTVSFLGGTCNVGPKTAEALDDMEVFLNPEVGMEASGIPRFTSPSAFLNSTLPSFGVSTGLPQGRLPELITQSKFLGDRPDTVAGPDPSQPDSAENEPGVIIDSNGCVHVLTAAEEAQRKLDLQQAVMAKMNAGGVQSNSHALQKPPNEALLHQNLQVKQRPAHSRLQTSSSHQSKATTLNRQSRSETSSPTNSTSALFQKITGLFRTRRASDQANNTLVERPFSIAH